MQIDLQKIREHAEQRLGDDSPESEGRLASFKRLLKLEMDRLRRQQRFGLGGREIASGRSYLVDLVVMRACQMVASDLEPSAPGELAACAIIAVGGYGRRELAPFSDVDILVLRPGGSTSITKEFAERLLPLLWDVGFEVGHSFRTVSECASLAREDLHVRNALCDARLVTGNPSLFDKLLARMRSAVYANPRASEAWVRMMNAEIRDRLVRFGDSVCMQEPNVKEGVGGLRDVHVVCWAGQARFGLRTLDRLVEAGLVDAGERGRVWKAYDFISRVRNEAHFLTGRRTDTLSLELQPLVASALGYVDKGGMGASELFMRDYFERAQELSHFNEAFMLRTGALIEKAPLFGLPKRSPSVGPGRRYRIRDGKLHSRDSSAGLDEASRILEPFEVAQQHGVTLSEELEHALRGSLRLVDRAFRDSEVEGRRFLALLARSGRVAPVLRAMHSSGFLARYIPAFQRVTRLVQHDHYHRYTVDEHTLRALDGLDALAASPPPGSGMLVRALAEVRDPRLLAFALLMHDVGKGRGGSHALRGAEIASRTAQRLGLGPDAVADVSFLVQKHLVMSQVSQRRDLSDPGLVRGFAETVGTEDRLNMLFVLTYADTSAVGPGVWNEWKATLLEDLYTKARRHLAGEAASPSSADRRSRLLERVVGELLPEYLRSDIEAFVDPLPERYLQAVGAEEMARHFALVRSLGHRTMVSDWSRAPDDRHIVLTLCVRDGPGVLARLAGTLTGAGLDILSMDAYSGSDGIVLDIFRLSQAPGPDRMDEADQGRIDQSIRGSLDGTHDVDAAVLGRMRRQPKRPKRRGTAPPRIRFEGPDALGRTLIEVRADDEPGLVYRLAATLAAGGLDISFAKIATEKNQALDVFYVTWAEGRPANDEWMAALEARLAAAVRAPR